MLLSGDMLASVVKPKTRRALGIVVDFVGDHLKDKKLTEFNTLDKLFFSKIWVFRSRFQQTIQVIPRDSLRSVR